MIDFDFSWYRLYSDGSTDTTSRKLTLLCNCRDFAVEKLIILTIFLRRFLRKPATLGIVRWIPFSASEEAEPGDLATLEASKSTSRVSEAAKWALFRALFAAKAAWRALFRADNRTLTWIVALLSHIFSPSFAKLTESWATLTEVFAAFLAMLIWREKEEQISHFSMPIVGLIEFENSMNIELTRKVIHSLERSLACLFLCFALDIMHSVHGLCEPF